MSRLRIRVELSRGGLGVPLNKVSSLTHELHRFLNLLAEDIQVGKPAEQPGERPRGDWLAFDFDRESLNFTAEYVGAIAGEQRQAFNSAFDGDTSLRRDTIAQFLHITEAISDDEVIGFGLYDSDDAPEPTEWRCLSRRDALRMAEEVQVLTSGMTGNRESHLPTVGDRTMGARMFGDRRDRSLAQTKLVEYVREVEAGLTSRLDSVESKVDRQVTALQEVRTQAKATETSFRNLLSTFEAFCEQATQKIEHLGPPALQASQPETSRWERGWVVAVTAVVVTLALAAWAVLDGDNVAPVRAKQETKPVVEAPVAARVTAPVTGTTGPTETLPVKAATAAALVPSGNLGTAMLVEFDATSPSWITLTDSDGTTLLSQLLVPGAPPRSVTLRQPAVLRAGNAGGTVVKLDGKDIGSIGPPGGVREVEFKAGTFTLKSGR